MKCNHPKVREVYLKTRKHYGNYICPDCKQPIECEQPIIAEDYKFTPRPTFRIARWSMAGVNDYWVKL